MCVVLQCVSYREGVCVGSYGTSTPSAMSALASGATPVSVSRHISLYEYIYLTGRAGWTLLRVGADTFEIDATRGLLFTGTNRWVHGVFHMETPPCTIHTLYI